MAVSAQLTGFLYNVVRESWIIAAVLTKYILALNLGFLAYRKNLSLESFEENLLDWSKPMTLFFAALGAFSAFTGGFGLEINFPFISQLITALTLGYLFWKY